MATQVIIELNENIGPLFRGDPSRISRVSLLDRSDGVDVIDILDVPDLKLVQLTDTLRNVVELHKQDEYVGGLLEIDHVYIRTNRIGRVQTNLTYYKRIHVSDLESPNEHILAGDLFLSNVEYPQLASNTSDSIVENRFYHDANKKLEYQMSAFLRTYGDTIPNSDLFRHNQHEILMINCMTVRGMNLFENAVLYPEEILDELRDGLYTSSILDDAAQNNVVLGSAALVDVLGATADENDELNTAFIQSDDEDDIPKIQSDDEDVPNIQVYDDEDVPNTQVYVDEGDENLDEEVYDPY